MSRTSRTRESGAWTVSRLLLALFMTAAGGLHFVVPAGYAQIVPRILPAPYAWVYASGAAEIAGGVLLSVRRTRRLGAWWTVGLLIVVFPANVQMALDGGLRGVSGVLDSPLAAWLRLPLQLPLIAWAWAHTRR